MKISKKQVGLGRVAINYAVTCPRPAAPHLFLRPLPARQIFLARARHAEGAIWAENIPFNETRDYVQRVLANTTDYAAVLGDPPQTLKARLGQIGPLPPGTVDPSVGLP